MDIVINSSLSPFDQRVDSMLEGKIVTFCTAGRKGDIYVSDEMYNHLRHFSIMSCMPPMTYRSKLRHAVCII